MTKTSPKGADALQTARKCASLLTGLKALDNQLKVQLREAERSAKDK